MKRKATSLLVLALSAFALTAGVVTMTSCGSGDNTSAVGGYKITVEGTGFTVNGLPEGNTAEEGARIRFTIDVTEEGKVVGSVKVNGETLTPGSGGRYSFNMPAGNVTIVVTVVGVSSIEADVAEAKTGFLVGSAFDSTGVKVKAHYDSGETATLTSGFTVSSPDLTEAGEKTVTLTYGGLTATYKIQVGDLTRGSAEIAVKDGKPVLTLRGTYSGFTSVAQLSAAAKGSYIFDLQYNESYSIGAAGHTAWGRMLKDAEIAFADDGAGKFKYEVDLSSLEGAGGKGQGYTLHFNTPNVDSGDIGEAGDWAVTESVNQTIKIGDRTFTLVGYPGSDQGSQFWGNYGLIILDESTPSMTTTDIDLQVKDNKAYAIVKGTYAHVDTSTLDGKILCDIQELYAWTEVANLASAEVTFVPENAADSGRFEIAFDITDALGNANPYFFHFHFDPAGNPVANEHNVNWDAATMTAKEIVDPVNGGKISFGKSPTTDWSSGLAVLTFLGGDFVKADGASFAKVEDKALFTVEGDYANITTDENGDYHLDAQALGTWEYVVGGDSGVTPEISLTPDNSGKTQGRFAVTVDLAGKLTSGVDYFFHWGKPTGTNDQGEPSYGNLYKFTGSESASFTLGEGTYTLRVYSGATEQSDTWRNGLLVVRYDAN